MVPPKLARHPHPHPTESLPGYVLRLSEANGHPSPRRLFRLAGMIANESSFTRFACSKLASIANLPTLDLEQLAFTRSEKGPESIFLLKNRVSAKDLNLGGARVCPECVAEKGFIEAHWHIELMVACPVHAKAVIWFCGKCRSRLNWLRPGLLECKCGTPILNPPLDRYSAPELSLLDLIRQKALDDQIRYRHDLSMPVKQLEAMSLQSLLSLVRFLGKKRLIASRSSKPQLGITLLRKAASVLTNWPFNFEIFLNDICPQVADGGASALSKDFANIYEVVDRRMTARFQGKKSLESATSRFITCSPSTLPYAQLTEPKAQCEGQN